MKNLVKLAMPLAMALVMTACGGNQEEANHHEDGTMHEGEMTHEPGTMNGRSASVTIKDSDLNAVYQHYVHLTTALVNDDVQEAQSAANAIEAGAKELNGGNALAASASRISSASAIETQREAYESLSGEMVKLVRSTGLENGELYVQFCPMANNNKGATWLSANKEIQNPYMGQKMLACGENRGNSAITPASALSRVRMLQ